ncbi:MAG TPA: hypothetical protein VIU38_00075 [Anaerolineales bacterium]
MTAIENAAGPGSPQADPAKKAVRLDIDAVSNSQLVINLLSTVAGKLPQRTGYQVADLAAVIISQQKNSKLVRAIRANQWVISGERLGREELEAAVRATLRHSARAIFDLYHYVQNLAAAGERVTLEPAFEQLTRRPEFDSRGLLIAGIHGAGFDLVLRWFCHTGRSPLVLTVPELRGGRQTEFEMRRQGGMNLVPANMAGLRHALRHLELGGAVLTGIDRPIRDPRVQPRFFNKPAALPVHYVQLAARAKAQVVLAASRLEEDGKYHADISEPVEMTTQNNEMVHVLRDAERILQMAAEFISRVPHQWVVPLPVWPSVMGKIPQ